MRDQPQAGRLQPGHGERVSTAWPPEPRQAPRPSDRRGHGCGSGGPSCRACCLWLWGPRRSDLLQPSSAPSARPAAWGAAWNGESKGDTTDGAGPELGDLRLIALTWSPVVWGSGETGAAGLVETPFFSFALPAFPEEAPRSIHPGPSRVTVRREVTGTERSPPGAQTH